jgi:uncharacterized protein YuzE
MKTLLSAVPELVAELSALLEEQGRTDVSSQLDSAVLDCCSYDADADAGYIRLLVSPPSLHFASLSSPVAETVSFYMERGLNLDITHDGDLFGIEFLGRNDVLARLKDAHAF